MSNITETELIDNLRSFLHLTTQAPIELVCKSALYLLTHVPSTRHAVFEYMATFYKVATVLHLRYNINQRNPNHDLTAEMNHITPVNHVIELVESSICSLIEKSKQDDIWPLEISIWLIELIGEIILQNSITMPECPGITTEEINAYKSPTIIEGLNIWSNQCKPTQSILNHIEKFFALSSKPTQSNIIDYILNSSLKYSSKFDWAICYFSSLNPKIFFEKLLLFGLQDSQASLLSPIDNQTKMNRINVVNFFATNYLELVLNDLNEFFIESIDEKSRINKFVLIYILKMASQSSALLNLLLNDCLKKSNDDENSYQMINFRYLIPYIVENDTHIINHIYNTAEQVNNCIAIYDMIVNFIDWMIYENDVNEEGSEEMRQIKIIESCVETFVDKMISNVYKIKSRTKSSDEIIPFLNSLNLINGTNLDHLIRLLITNIETNAKINHDLLYKLITLLSINSNDNVATSFLSHLFLMSNNQMSKGYEESNLIKLRQEINSFHPHCIENVIKSLIKQLTNEKNEHGFKCLIQNLISLHDWDVQNNHFMSKNISVILIERECFTNMISQISMNETLNYSNSIIGLYNRILSCEDEDFQLLKLNITDLIQISHKLVEYFFDMNSKINDENVSIRVKSINESITLIKNILIHISNNLDESILFRNILIRNLVDKLFSIIGFQSTKNIKDEHEEIFDENSNLFNLNIEQINNEIMFQKSRLKSVRNKLVEFPKNRQLNLHASEYKSIINFSFMDLIEILCSKDVDLNVSPPITEIEQLERLNSKQDYLLSEQMCNIADLLVQHVLLDQFYIDFQWPISLNDSDDNFEAEVETMKLYIERDVSVQNKFENVNNNFILWQLLEFLSIDESSLNKCNCLIRSILASLIVQWDSYQEQSTRNIPKTLSTTLKLLNVISKILPKPLCLIVDILPLLNSYETHILLILIYKNLRLKYNPIKTTANNLIREWNQKSDEKHLRYIFQKNIGKLAPFYSKFFA